MTIDQRDNLFWHCELDIIEKRVRFKEEEGGGGRGARALDPELDPNPDPNSDP